MSFNVNTYFSIFNSLFPQNKEIRPNKEIHPKLPIEMIEEIFRKNGSDVNYRLVSKHFYRFFQHLPDIYLQSLCNCQGVLLDPNEQFNFLTRTTDIDKHLFYLLNEDQIESLKLFDAKNLYKPMFLGNDLYLISKKGLHVFEKNEIKEKLKTQVAFLYDVKKLDKTHLAWTTHSHDLVIYQPSKQIEVTIPIGETIYDFEFSETRLVARCDDELKIFNPISGTKLHSLLVGEVKQLTVAGDFFAFTDVENLKVSIFDSLFNEYAIDARDLDVTSVMPNLLTLHGDMLYVVHDKRLKIFDVKEKKLIQLILLDDSLQDTTITYALMQDDLLLLGKSYKKASGPETYQIELWSISKVKKIHTFSCRFKIDNLVLKKHGSGLLELISHDKINNKIEIWSPLHTQKETKSYLDAINKIVASFSNKIADLVDLQPNQ